jgi:hypothetical protein
VHPARKHNDALPCTSAPRGCHAQR